MNIVLFLVYYQADEFTKATAGGKLMVIADQIKYLQEQARKVFCVSEMVRGKKALLNNGGKEPI